MNLVDLLLWIKAALCFYLFIFWFVLFIDQVSFVLGAAQAFEKNKAKAK